MSRASELHLKTKDTKNYDTTQELAMDREQLPQLATPMTMLGRAVESGASMEVLEKLMGLHERWEANQARKAFDAAIAHAKAEIGPIFKNRKVDFTSAKGRTNYEYEDLAEIARTVDPILAKYGLSYRWRTTTDANLITVTCIVSHRDGHSEENSLPGPRDETGNKNAIQSIGSTVTYLQRYTLKSALGLAASKDDDAHATGGGVIDKQQLDVLQCAIDEVGADVPRLCRHYKIEKISDLPASKYQDAIDKLTAKQSKKAEASA